MLRKESFCLVLAMIFVNLTACGKQMDPPVTTGEIGIIKDEQFGNVCPDLPVEDFNALGFTLGDSINVTFDNGYSLMDIPYYNGFFTRTGEPVACSYPGYTYVALAFSKGDSMWEVSGVTEESKITITLNEKGKYLTVQNALGVTYKNERADYATDEQFANFYAITGGNLKENTFYRSASPCNDTYHRASYVNAIVEKTGIQYVLNLSDSSEEIEKFLTDNHYESTYYASLYKNGKVLPMDISVNFRSKEIAQIISAGLLKMCDEEGPYLLHCLEGKDRTGFVSVILLALAGANTAEIEADYMQSYNNYYGISKTDTPDQYNAVVTVVVDDLLYYLSGEKDGTDLTNVSYTEGAKNYLRLGGLTDEQISQIIDFISQ